MSRPLSALCTLAALAWGSAAAQGYVVVQKIPGPDGGYDYMSVDRDAGRLFVAREYGVMAIDLKSGIVTEKLIEANDVSAVLILPGTSAMLSTVYGDDKAVIFDRMTGARLGEVATGKSPDAAAFDPASGLVFVMNAKSNNATLIDLKAMTSPETIALGGKPEAAVSDGLGRVFINIEDTAEIAVIDVAARAVAARYRMDGCIEPTGIAFDAATATLIAACHNGTVKLIDARTGADRGAVPVGENADGAIFDPATRRAFIPCNEGTLSIIQLDERGRASGVQAVATQVGARTAAFDPKTGRLYLAAAEFTTDAAGNEQRVSGTFNIIVVAPQ